MDLKAWECPPKALSDPLVPTPKLGSRELFPDLKAQAYLAHAAISPLNLAGVRQVTQCVSDLSRNGSRAFLRWANQRARERDLFSEMWGVAAQDIALTAGTSYGILDLALALPLAERDEIVTFRGEFPANVLPFLSAAGRAGATVHLLPQPNPREEYAVQNILSGLEQRLELGARVVSVSAVQFQTGMRMPLKEITELAHGYGARVLVDAIQCSGGMPLDVGTLNVDAVTVGAHKWLLGAEGAGALYIKEEFYRGLRPLTLGWESLTLGEAFLFEGKGHLDYFREPKESAQAFEGSTPNVLGHAALEAGLEICLSLGPKSIFDHVQRYHDDLEGELVSLGLTSLRALDEDSRSNLLCFDLPADVAIGPFVRALGAEGIVCSSPDGLVRFAPHFANSLEEIPIVVRAVHAGLRLARL